MNQYVFRLSRDSAESVLVNNLSYLTVRTRSREALWSEREWDRLRERTRDFLSRGAFPVNGQPHAGVQLLEAVKGGFSANDHTLIREEANVQSLFPVLTYQNSDEPVLPTGNIVVKFNASLDESRCHRILNQHKLILKLAGRPLAYSQNRFFAAVPEDSTEAAFDIAERLYRNPEVEESYPELVMRRQNRAMWPKVWDGQWWLADLLPGIAGQIHASEVWNAGFTGLGIRIAVIDEEFDLAHHEFQPFPQVLNKVMDPATASAAGVTANIVNTRTEGHGNGVAGLACASGVGRTHNGQTEGISGVAPGATLIPIACDGRNLGLNSVMEERGAFQWALDKKADVVCCSWGPPDANGNFQPMHPHIREIVDRLAASGRANGRGAAIVFAAGNERDGVDLDGWAGRESVIAVGACDQLGSRAFGSEFGDRLSCLAPGADAGPEGRMRSADITGFASTLQTFHGTSASAAIVAGAAALMLHANPDLTGRDVKKQIELSCDRTPHLPGEGPYVNGRSKWQGNGRINAMQAVNRITK